MREGDVCDVWVSLYKSSKTCRAINGFEIFSPKEGKNEKKKIIEVVCLRCPSSGSVKQTTK
jgi:hypothetical protein